MAINAVNTTTIAGPITFDKVMIVDRIERGRIENGVVKGSLLLVLRRYGYDSNNVAVYDPNSQPVRKFIPDVFEEANNKPAFAALMASNFALVEQYNAAEQLV